MPYRYSAHGLVVSSEVELALPAAPSIAGSPDLTFRVGPTRPVSDHPAPGRPLAELDRDGRRVYSFAQDGDRTILRYPTLFELVGDLALSEVTAHLHPGADPKLLGVLGSGNLLAVHLLLRHQLVLHASAVRHDDRALAFVGCSGMGKSTLAAAFCAAGAALVTDDVLRVDLGPDRVVRVYPGATENRLRTGSRDLAHPSPGREVRHTADGRLAVRSRRRVVEPLPLGACVLPRMCRDADRVLVRRLRPATAMLWLLRFPKIPGWCEPGSTDRIFQAVGDLVERVPVFEVTVPWGIPFRPETLTDLLDGVSDLLDGELEVSSHRLSAAVEG